MAMLDTILGLALAIAPFAAVVAVLSLTAHVQNLKVRAAARQIALTDAVHRELGTVVAPVVKHTLVGPWDVVIPVPFRRTDIVCRVLGIVHDTLARMDDRSANDMRIVLTEQPEPPRAHAGA